MEHQPTYVGIDVAKDWVDVAVRPAGCVWRVNYEESEIAALLVRLQTLQPTAVILESTGGLETPLVAAPAATVTTIHQAKGREWDVVIVGSLHLDNDEVDRVGEELASYCRRPSFEPAQRIADFDYARQHYVAFSRPKRLLALTAAGAVHPRFAEAWDGLPRWDRMDRSALAGQRFDPPEATRDAAAIPEASRLIPYLKRLDVWVGAAPDVAAIQPKEMMNTMNAKHAVIAMARAPPARRRVA